MFEGRLPAKLQDARAEDRRQRTTATRSGSSRASATTRSGMNAVAGRRPETVEVEPFRFDQMRPGCYDPHARVRDMDLGGVWASLNFPSMITGLLRPRVLAARGSASSGYAVDARVQRLDVRGVVAAAPRPVHPARHHVPRRRRAGRGRDPPQRRARLRGRDAPRAPAPDRAPVDLRRALGPDHARVRGDRHRDLPARRLVGHGRRRRRARRHRPLGATLFGQLSLTVVRGVAVVGLDRAVSRT